METYTLQRFYHEAQTLIEKYDFVKNDYCFETSFSVKSEKSAVAKLSCNIYYHHSSYNDAHKNIYVSQPTPAGALGDFEERLQEATGKFLIERVAINVE